MFKKMIKKGLPVLVLITGVLIFGVLTSLRPEPEKAETKEVAPLVEIEKFNSQTEKLLIKGNGTVRSVVEISLIPQVPGNIVHTSGNMENGGFFRKGEVLLKIDPTDYELAVETAKAEVARQEMQYEIEKEEAKIAEKEWNLYQESNTSEKPSSLVLRVPQLKLAEANLNSAEARLKMAELNLSRTKIKAPFNGRVKLKRVDVGQYVAPGTVLATIFSTEKAEIVIPLKHDDLAWIDMPNTKSKSGKPRVLVKGEFAGRENIWNGYLDRIEGELDPRDRMINWIVQVDRPYDNGNDFPLLNGLFVEVDIEGREVENIYKIPRHIIRENNTLWVTANGVLDIRKIHILKYFEDFAYVNEGLSDGESVVTSALSLVVNGMKVREVTRE